MLAQDGEAIATLMRTPGHDFELAAGFSCHEAIATPASIRGIAYCTDVDLTPEQELNVVTVTLTEATDIGHRHTGLSVGSSACGVCGKTSIDAITATSRYAVAADPVRLAPEVVAGLPAATVIATEDAAFAELIRAAYAHHADLLKFGGDAILLFFRGREHAARAAR